MRIVISHHLTDSSDNRCMFSIDREQKRYRSLRELWCARPFVQPVMICELMLADVKTESWSFYSLAEQLANKLQVEVLCWRPGYSNEDAVQDLGRNLVYCYLVFELELVADSFSELMNRIYAMY